MKETIKWIKNDMPKDSDFGKTDLFNSEEIKKVYNFHKSFPQYSQTPLVSLENLSKKFGISGLYVKDESFRFGLNAFKVLGSSYAIARFIAKKLGKDISELPFESLVNQETIKKLGKITFYTATDGNHGRGAAWAAAKLGCQSVVLMPKGSSQIRLNNIIKEGADAKITDLNYDDSVRLVETLASKDPNGVIVQDTAWKGYEEIPAWVMQGYATLSFEAHRQLEEIGIKKPTHIFVQAGVGSFPSAVIGYFSNVYKENPPTTIIVEASAADCHYRSVKENKIVSVKGDLKTLMAGLACGEANPIAWKILKNHGNFFVSIPDWVSAKGMRILGAPLKGDKQIISGESGAVSAGLLAAVMQDENYNDLRKDLGLNENSEVLIFSTEGDTDPDQYEKIVWDGEF